MSVDGLGKLGVDLAKLKLAPRFCPAALVMSEFPSSTEGIKTQRTRWEHGHIGMIVKEGAPLIMQSIQQVNLNMLAMALDMCVPPLALLVLIISTLSAVGMFMALMTQQMMPWSCIFLDLLLVAVAVILAWYKFGRHIVKFSELLMVPFYILAKIPLYIKFVFKRQSEWVRSKRDN
jgi:cellulose synthase/poly-beta-1,6-N-acetylglucosamine synthase-like glycosyltransferase